MPALPTCGIAIFMGHHIEKTIDRVGFEGLTGQAVYETIQGTAELKPMEGVQTFDFGKDKRAPSKARIVQVKGGKFTYATDWMTAGFATEVIK